jgi:hypothetical protein
LRESELGRLLVRTTERSPLRFGLEDAHLLRDGLLQQAECVGDETHRSDDVEFDRAYAPDSVVVIDPLRLEALLALEQPARQEQELPVRRPLGNQPLYLGATAKILSSRAKYALAIELESPRS